MHVADVVRTRTYHGYARFDEMAKAHKEALGRSGQRRVHAGVGAGAADMLGRLRRTR